jgi:hypothetical protein
MVLDKTGGLFRLAVRYFTSVFCFRASLINHSCVIPQIAVVCACSCMCCVCVVCLTDACFCLCLCVFAGSCRRLAATIRTTSRSLILLDCSFRLTASHSVISLSLHFHLVCQLSKYNACCDGQIDVDRYR